MTIAMGNQRDLAGRIEDAMQTAETPCCQRCQSEAIQPMGGEGAVLATCLDCGNVFYLHGEISLAPPVKQHDGTPQIVAYCTCDLCRDSIG